MSDDKPVVFSFANIDSFMTNTNTTIPIFDNNLDDNKVAIQSHQEEDVVAEEDTMEKPIPSKESKKILIISENTRWSSFMDTEKYEVKIKPQSNRSQTKWQYVLHVLESLQDDLTEKFKFVWIPDLHVESTKQVVDEFFDIVESEGLVISQPSLIRDTRDKSYIHNTLLNNNTNSSFVRKSTFVESKMPCFDTKFAKDELLPILKDNSHKLMSGWGIDMWWSYNFDDLLYVVDKVQFMNTKSTANNNIGINEMKYFVKKYEMKMKN